MQRKLFVWTWLCLAVSLAGCTMTHPDLVSLSLRTTGQGTTFPQPGTHRFAPDTLVELEARPAPGWIFSHWEGEVAEPHSAQTHVVADGRKTVRAVFLQDGLVRKAPGGLIYQRTDGTEVKRRPLGMGDIEYIMIHAMSDAAANPTDPYRIERIRSIFDEYRVEAHYVIDREGQVYQFVEDALAARHAGSGSWGGDPRLTNNMNRYALGIELLGIGTAEEMVPVIGSTANSMIRPEDRGYTAAQYSALRDLLALLQNRYGVPRSNILGHNHYDPDRKWDPGQLFQWDRL